jgi:hypothetical protein
MTDLAPVQLAPEKAAFIASLLPAALTLDSLAANQPGRPVMNNAWRGLAISMLLLIASASAQSAPLDAIWKTHQISFYYGSRTTAYSCNALTERIASILRRVGAERDLRVAATACESSLGLARIEVRFRAPVLATAANVSAATAHDATQLLAARVRGEALPDAEDLERFDAEWQTISFARDAKLRLAPADCDLVQQMLKVVFSRMAIRVEKESLWCSQFGNAQRPRLTLAALVKSDAARDEAKTGAEQ